VFNPPSLLARRARIVFAACVVVLCGCASNPPTRSETAAVAASEPDEVVAALMAAEFAWQDGRRESAARHHARAASLSPDPAVAQRAAQVALIARDTALARQGLSRWREIESEASAQSQIEAGIAFLEGNI
jgi:uncharacterized protein HemY